MGIYDRDYYRREGPGFLESLGSRGLICKWLILVNIGIYVLQILWRIPGPGGLAQPFTDWFLLNVKAVEGGQVWRLLTYAFLHAPADPFHLIFNMLFLWWFGSDVEDLYGPREFLAFYLASALAGGIAFLLAAMAGLSDARLCLGASGAVMAVTVLCALHYPSRIIYVLMFLPVPIWLFVVFYVLQDLIGFLGFGGGNVAFSVHLGGAVFGFLYHRFNWRLAGSWPSLGNWQKQRARPNLRVYREEEASAPVPVAAPPVAVADVDEQLEAKLDAVLEKVAQTGQNSLTDGERQILMRASEVYRKRRT